MPRFQWNLSSGRPVIEIELIDPISGDAHPRLLLADTGAGGIGAAFEIILHLDDCQQYGIPSSTASLGGAYTGQFPVFNLRITIPTIGFDDIVPVVGLPDLEESFDGIACFRFLNRFSYGNFGDRARFGLEM